MGIDNLSTRSTGQTIVEDFFNVLKRILGGDIVPRNVSGIATANAGLLGTPTYPFMRANITTGFFVCGEIKMLHDFNGAITPGQGWMKCNGDQVTEAAYDAIHGADSWDTYIGSSPLANKYLPNMNNRFAVGATSTTQDGSVAITYEGQTGHQINIAHSHTVNAHTHTYSHTHSIANGFTGEGLQGSQSGSGASTTTQSQSNATSGSTSPGTDSQLSSTQSIKPESCAFEFWIRII